MKARYFLRSAMALALLLPSLAVADLVSPPVITPPGGSYEDSVEVSMFTATAGATIYFTTDGTIPTTASEPFARPLLLTSSATIKAFAVRAGDDDSAVSTAVYTVVPTPEIPTPTVTINGKKSLKTKKKKVKISGTATNATSVEYQIGEDGDARTAKGTTNWSFTVKFKPGKHVIFVTAIGEEEDSDPAQITVTTIRHK